MFNLVCAEGHLHYSPMPEAFEGAGCGTAHAGTLRRCNEVLELRPLSGESRDGISAGSLVGLVPASSESGFAYRLVVLTNGRPCLRKTLESFAASVRPLPAESVLVADGGEFEPFEPWGGWRVEALRPARGFCGATAAGWRFASEPGPEFVFWLEDDFLFERALDLRSLAEVLEANEHLTQMGLMRGPANDLEEAAGGCVALRPDLYEARDGWLESRTNHSTGCSLMRREFMAEHPWPEYENCEGRFSIDMLAAGFTFGVWGMGEPWVQHVGVRAGSGY